MNPYSFTNGALQVGFKINLDSRHINQANSMSTIKPNFPELGIELQNIDEILTEMAIIYLRLKNQNKYKYKTKFSARFEKQDEDNQSLDETEIYIYT